MDKDKFKPVCELIALRRAMFNFLIEQKFPELVLKRICVTDEDVADIAKVLNEEFMHPVKNILEVGSYVGVSTILLANLCKDANIDCVDPNLSVDSDMPEGIELRKKTGDYFSLLGMNFSTNIGSRIQRYDAFFSCLPQSQSMEFHKLKNPNILGIPIFNVDNKKKYDLIFIDADHYHGSVYSDLLLACKLLSQDGCIILHDVLGYWGKEVVLGVKQFLSRVENYYFRTSRNIGIIKRKD